MSRVYATQGSFIRLILAKELLLACMSGKRLSRFPSNAGQPALSDGGPLSAAVLHADQGRNTLHRRKPQRYRHLDESVVAGESSIWAASCVIAARASHVSAASQHHFA